MGYKQNDKINNYKIHNWHDKGIIYQDVTQKIFWSKS